MKFINIFQEGGIGDLIISLPLIKYFEKDGYQINLYTLFPEIASFFFPEIKSIFSKKGLNRNSNDFEYSITISDMIFINKKKDVILPEFIQDIYEECQKKYPDWKEYLEKHPFCANQMAHKAVSLNLTRWTLPFYFIGKEYQPYVYPNKIKEIKIPNRYITIHDGFDASNTYNFARSTKSWSIHSWESFIRLFKEKYPEMYVVQLGGVKHQKIKGVDINLAGQIPFEKSLEYLNSSILHIDSDSGLVHARKLFNKISIVLFGSTNFKYFGYHKNINMSPNFCGDCWWLKSDWMQNCKDGHSTPKCIDSIKPEDVFKIVKSIL